MKSRISFNCILCTIIGVLTMFFIYDTYWYSKKISCDLQNIEQVRTGDLLLTEGTSLKGEIVKFLSSNETKEQYSHIGIADVENDRVCVVHMSTDSGKIVKQDFMSFVNDSKSHKTDIYRINSPIPEWKLKRKLHNLLGRNIPFDYKFDIMSDDSYYCTELVFKLLKSVGNHDVDMLRGHYFIYPIDFANAELSYYINSIN